MAELYQNTRRPDKAKGILNDLEKKTDDRQGAMLTYADYLLRAEGPTADCRKMIEAAIQLNEKDPRGYVEMARFHEAAEEWDKAVVLWDKVMSMGVKDMPAFNESEVESSLIEATIRTRQFDKAKKAIDAMLARDKDDSQAALLLNMWYQEQGQTDQAKEVLAAAMKAHEGVAMLYRARGSLCMRLGDLQEAQADLAKAKKLDPSDSLVGMALGRAYERSHLPDKARAEYISVISQTPSYRPAYDRLSMLYLKEQDWGKFSNLLEQARQTFPDDPALVVQEGQMWLQRKELDKGLAKMKQAAEMPRGGEIGILGAYLATLGSAGRYADVLSATEKSAALASPPAWVLAARATAMVKLNQQPAAAEALFAQAAQTMAFGEGSYIVQRAQEAYGDVVAADKVKAWGQAVPKNWEWQLQVGLLFRARAAHAPKGPERDAKIQEAAAELIKARDMVENTNAGLKADIDFNLGTFLQLQEKPREAEQAYLRVIKATPRHMLANNNLAVLYCDDLDEPKKAVECAETIMKYHDVDANVLDTYGWALARNGQLDKALAVLTRAKMQDPSMTEIRYHLGWTLEKLKRNSEARVEYQSGAGLVEQHKDEKLQQLLQEGLGRTK
ncbi:MAG: tetratricopeptide repeat protein [Planctomycetota bacterium]|nr:tetratricopeptide repeat protein [Planctomycetota bacterium]